MQMHSNIDLEILIPYFQKQLLYKQMKDWMVGINLISAIMMAKQKLCKLRIHSAHNSSGLLTCM